MDIYFVPNKTSLKPTTPEQRLEFAQKIASSIFDTDSVKSCPVIWDERARRFELHRDTNDFWLYPPDDSSNFWRLLARNLNNKEVRGILDPFSEVFMNT